MLDEAIATIVPLCLDLKERHSRGEKVHVHPSCIGPGPDGLSRMVQPLTGPPTNPRDRACIAPELQQKLEAGGAKASVFAVGAILYEMLTGGSVGPGMRRPCEVNPSLPESLELLLSKALVGDAAHRPDDLGALASAMHHLAPMKSIHPPDVDQSTLDRTDDFEVDIKLSLLPPPEMVSQMTIPRAPAPMHGDPLGQVVERKAPPGPQRVDLTARLGALKARLESDPRPRYVVNKDRMDHGPFSAVEVLQQIASNSFVGDDTLRDELSGQSRPIKEWEEFAPFAEQTALGRELKAETKEVARVESAEKKSGVAKIAIGLVAVLLLGTGGFLWYSQARGSRSDRVAIEDDPDSIDIGLEGGIGGKKKAARAGGGGGGGGGAGGGGGGGGYAAGGMSYEAALGSNNQQVTIGGAGSGPDLSDAQLAGPLRNATFINACGAPDSMKVQVRVAVKMGHAVGVSVYTTPSEPRIAGCIDGAVRRLSWPANAKMDFVTTRY